MRLLYLMRCLTAFDKLFYLRQFLLWGVVLAAPLRVSHSCAPLSDPDFPDHFTFINPHTLDSPEELPYWMSFDKLYENYYETQQLGKRKANVQEWQSKVCKQATLEDIDAAIYKYTPQQFTMLHNAAVSKDHDIPYEMRKNGFAIYLARNKCGQTTAYLHYAKTVEPYVVRSNRQWTSATDHTRHMQRLIDQGKNEFLQCTSDYLRMRYLYQMVRLAHYSGQYQQILDLWDAYFPKILLDEEQPTIIYYWALSHRAEALYKTGNRSEGAYLYAHIYSKVPHLRPVAQQSFRIANDEEWKLTYLKCMNQQERTSMYAMRAAADHAEIVPEMYAIYELEPNSPFLNTLLLKEMQKLEKALMSITYDADYTRNRRFFKIPRDQSGNYAVDLLAFVRMAATDQQVSNPDFWKLAEGYLTVMSGDYYAAEKIFAKLSGKMGNELLAEQLTVYQRVLQIASWNEMSPKVEEEAYRIITDDPLFTRYPDLEPFLKNKLSYLYFQKKQLGRAFLMVYDFTDLRYHPETFIIDDLLELARKQNPTRMERWLIKNSGEDELINDLLDLKGTVLLSKFHLEAAYEVLKQIPDSKRAQYGLFNPISERLRSCVHCPISARADSLQLSKTALVKKLLDMRYDAQANRENGARTFYGIGLAFFNMSYYGYEWKAIDYYRSGGNWLYYNEENVYPLYQSPRGNQEQKQLSEALSYFEITQRLSDGVDNELAARATFMAARCRLLQYTNSQDFRTFYNNNIPDLPAEYMTYYDKLLDKYTETDFYQKAINECAYLRAYASE